MAGKRSSAEDHSSSSDDSSSDEEEKARLKEAVQGSFVENVKAENKEISTEMSNQKNSARGGVPKKSLRTSLQDDFIGDEILQTTPEFKNFVAKRLSKHLESLISESDGKQAKDAKTESKNAQSGIKLFGSSSKFVVNNGCEVRQYRSKKYKRRKPSSESSDSETESKRLAEAAISADFIIANSSTILTPVKSSSKESSEDDVIDRKDKKKRKKKKRKKTDESCDQVEETIVDSKSNMKCKKNHKNDKGLEIIDKNHKNKNKSKKKDNKEKETKTM